MCLNAGNSTDGVCPGVDSQPGLNVDVDSVLKGADTQIGNFSERHCFVHHVIDCQSNKVVEVIEVTEDGPV